MKIFFVIILLSGLYTLPCEAAPNILIVDSSYVPLMVPGYAPGNGQCFLMSEDGQEVPEVGDCFEAASWQDLAKQDLKLWAGLIDRDAGVSSQYASLYLELEQKDPRMAGFREKYLLMSHGSKMAFLVSQFSSQKAQIIPVRSVVASGMTGATNKSGCKLLSPGQNQLLPFHEKLALVLKAKTTLRVVLWGGAYKREWVKEDNPQCETGVVENYWQSFVTSWQKFLKLHANRLFVVSSNAADDLWQTLRGEPNLLVVSEFQSETLPALAPMPGTSSGLSTTVRGADFTAAKVSGLAVKEWSEKASQSLVSLRTKLQRGLVTQKQP